MAPRLSLVGSTPADQARDFRAQAKAHTHAAVKASLGNIDALVSEIDQLLALDHDKGGVPQSLERLRRHLISESAQIVSLQERG